MKFQTFQCAIHEIRWESMSTTDPVECPHCIADDLRTVKDQLCEITNQRNLLLKAIELKTSVPVESLRE